MTLGMTPGRIPGITPAYGGAYPYFTRHPGTHFGVGPMTYGPGAPNPSMGMLGVPNIAGGFHLAPRTPAAGRGAWIHLQGTIMLYGCGYPGMPMPGYYTRLGTPMTGAASSGMAAQCAELLWEGPALAEPGTPTGRPVSAGSYSKR